MPITIRPFLLPSDWPFTDPMRTPRRFVHQESDDDKDKAYYEAEAKKAFADRDAAKKKARELEEQIRDLQGKVLSDDDHATFAKLKEQAVQLEEERAKKAGEFETLRKQIEERHAKAVEKLQTEIKERDTKQATLSDRFRDTVVTAAFGSAADLFGGHDQSKTILDVELGKAALGKYVTVEDDEHDPRGYRIVVKNLRHEPILGKDGNPAPFGEAITELIESLPNKDRILRGSGKVGSGSSGGSSHKQGPVDLDATIRKAAQGDKEAIKALKDRQQPGGIVSGTAWEKRA